jgi:hypothetical protein
MDSNASKRGGGDELGAPIERAPPPPDAELLGRRDVSERAEPPLLDPADPGSAVANTPHCVDLARIPANPRAVALREGGEDSGVGERDEAADASVQCPPPSDDECVELLGPLLGPLLEKRDIFERELLPLLDPVDLAMLGRQGLTDIARHVRGAKLE